MFVCLLEEEQVFLHFAVDLFWVAFVERAWGHVSDASLCVLMRLGKVWRGGLFWLLLCERRPICPSVCFA